MRKTTWVTRDVRPVQKSVDPRTLADRESTGLDCLKFLQRVDIEAAHAQHIQFPEIMNAQRTHEPSYGAVYPCLITG